MTQKHLPGPVETGVVHIPPPTDQNWTWGKDPMSSNAEVIEAEYTVVGENNSPSSIPSNVSPIALVEASGTEPDSSIKRDRFGRFVTFVIASFLTFAIPVILSILLFGYFKLHNLGLITGTLVGVLLYIEILPTITVYVPLYQGIVGSNSFTGESVGFGPGLHLKHPWDVIHHDDTVSTKDVTKETTITTPSKDSQLITTFLLRWRPRTSQLPLFASHTISTINRAIVGEAEEFFTSLFPRLTAKEVQDGFRVISAYANALFSHSGNVDENGFTSIEKTLSLLIQQTMPHFSSAFGSRIETLEKKYGIQVFSVEITDIDLPTQVQEARDAEAEISPVLRATLRLLGFDPDIEADRKAYNALSPEAKMDAIKYLSIIRGTPGVTIQSLDVNLRGEGKDGIGGLIAAALMAAKATAAKTSNQGENQGGGNRRNKKKGGR